MIYIVFDFSLFPFPIFKSLNDIVCYGFAAFGMQSIVAILYETLEYWMNHLYVFSEIPPFTLLNKKNSSILLFSRLNILGSHIISVFLQMRIGGSV